MNTSVTGSTPHPEPAIKEPANNDRLPCRGCMADCPNYTTCDGMPWRKES
jgi:hypothetical protein